MIEWCNDTELKDIIREVQGTIPRRDLPRERLVSLARGEDRLSEGEVSGTMETRARLQKWLLAKTNFPWVIGQLPCIGEQRGHCTVYPCTEGQHLECLFSVEDKMV